MTVPPPSPIDGAISQLRLTLHGDAAECWSDVLREDTQAHRRGFVRAVFALVEGSLAVMKYAALSEHISGRTLLERQEVAILQEEAYELRDDGNVRIRPMFLQAKPNLRFSFDVFARTHGISSRPDYGGTGWVSFQKSLDVRNRITHPKVTKDITITDAELDDVKEAWVWFVEASLIIYGEGRLALVAKLEASGFSVGGAHLGGTAE